VHALGCTRRGGPHRRGPHRRRPHRRRPHRRRAHRRRAAAAALSSPDRGLVRSGGASNVGPIHDAGLSPVPAFFSIFLAVYVFHNSVVMPSARLCLPLFSVFSFSVCDTNGSGYAFAVFGAHCLVCLCQSVRFICSYPHQSLSHPSGATGVAPAQRCGHRCCCGSGGGGRAQPLPPTRSGRPTSSSGGDGGDSCRSRQWTQ